MTEISHLFKQGWKNFWRVKFVWLFILIASLSMLGPLLGCLYLLVFLLSIVGITGVSYIAVRTTNGETITLRDTLRGVRKYFGRITSFYILLGILGTALFMPFLCSLMIYTYPDPAQIGRSIWFAQVPVTFILGIFSAFFYLPIIDIIAKDSRVRDSIASAWKLIKGHPGLFLRIGLLYSVMVTIEQILRWIINSPGLSYFDTAAFGDVNPLEVVFSSNNLFSNFLIGIVGQILLAYFAYVFTQAYIEKSSNEY